MFRADRAHGNSLENLPPFALIAVLAIVVEASPMWVNGATILYCLARLGHMALYYLDVRKARPAPFALGILATLVLGGAAVWAI